MAITITDFALEKVSGLIKKSNFKTGLLRISLKGGGCSGMFYHFDIVQKAEDADKVFDFKNIKVCVDKKSYLFLNGMEIDYEETPFKSGIRLSVPNATRVCGCGESVAFK
jgi:iron-sulfur cluster assembly protein